MSDAAKRIKELERYNYDLAVESHGKSEQIEQLQAQLAESERLRYESIEAWSNLLDKAQAKIELTETDLKNARALLSVGGRQMEDLEIENAVLIENKQKTGV